MSAHIAAADPRALWRALAIPRATADALFTVAVAAVLCAIALDTGGGLQLEPLTRVAVGVDLAAGVLGATALLVGGQTRRAWGATTLLAMAALAALTALSITWAVAPDAAWIEANRTIAHLAVIVIGVALVRLAPQRWPGLLGGIVLAGAALCGYALATKVFPSALAPDEVFARLRTPFDYWNAVGLCAAMTAPACLWLGTRRSGHAAVNALAYPVLGLVLVALLLAYSRGSLLALAIGCAAWFAIVPLRLRGVLVLGTAAFGAGLVALWAFGSDVLASDRVELAQRVHAGRELGILLAVLMLGLLVAGLGIGFALARRSPSAAARRRAGVAVVCALAVVPIALVAGLALSDRGLTGSISKAFSDLTDTDTPPQVSNSPDRLKAVGSVRAQYWDEALRVFTDEPLHGVGADGYQLARLRYRHDARLQVRHAHGYVVQTLADLGIAGAAVSLALLAAWLAAAARTIALWGPGRRAPWSPERVGMATAAVIVVTFGAHSLIDWTWFIPGNAVVALLCAGWVAGRGPTSEPVAPRRRGSIGLRAVAAAGAVIAALLVAWAVWQPQRSVDESDRALLAAERGDTNGALAAVQRAHDINPLAIDPLLDRAAIEQGAGRDEQARRAYAAAVRLQPANPTPWLALARFELGHGEAESALRAVGSALYLDPKSVSARTLYVRAVRLGAG